MYGDSEDRYLSDREAKNEILEVGRRMYAKNYVVSNDGQYVYGFAVAEDTGVRGNMIDLYMDTYRECIQFGVRECTVYVLD